MVPTHLDVFLSHNSQDKPVVLALARALQQAGIEPWLDAWYLVGGDRWQQVLGDALRASGACAVFYGAHGLGDWHREELDVAQDRAAKDPDFRLFPVLLPGAPDEFDPNILPPFLSTRMWVDLRHGVDDPARLEELIVAIKGVHRGADERADGLVVSEICPYRGLQTFDEEHAEFFFGREADVQRLLEKLKGGRFLAVVGPSGSGKSSLVRAGLLPALRRNGLPGSALWQSCVIKPGAKPLDTLAAHLVQLSQQGAMQQTLDQLQTDPRTVHLSASLGLLDRPPEMRLLWVVDQAEEVFTLCHDDRERQAFLDNLLYAASVPDGRCAVVLTLRADFYPRLAVYPELASRLGTDQYLVSPLEEQGLRDAISKPAARVGLVFEPGLVERILEDVQSQPGALPLLEHALLELWERRRGRTLTLAAYQEIGGVAGALAKRADASFATLTSEQQAIARRAMLRLTQPGEGTEDTRRRAELEELATRPEERDEVRAVVDRLVAARLLTTSGDEQTGSQWVDVAHEALIRAWPRLRTWLDEDRQSLVIHRRLTEAAHDWQDAARDPDLLYRGARLTEARALAAQHPDALNALEREFLAESAALREREIAAADERRRTQEQLRRRVMAGLAVFSVVALLLALLAGWQWRDAGAQRVAAQGLAATAEAERNIAFVRATEAAVARETAEANGAEAERQATIAAAQKLEAVNAAATAEAQRVGAEEARTEAEAQRQVALYRQLAAQGRTHTDDLDLGLLLAAAAYDLNPDDPETRSSLLAALTEQPRLKQILHGPAGNIRWLDYSVDGSMLAAASDDGKVHVWRLDGGKADESLAIKHGNSGRVYGVLFSPDDEQMASVNIDEATIRFWNPTTGAATGPIIHLDPDTKANIFEFSPRNDVLATAGADGAIEFWSRSTATSVARAEDAHPGGVNSLSFRPDGSELMTAGADGVVRFWNAATLEPTQDPLVFEEGSGVAALFSLDGTIFVTNSSTQSGGELRFWDAITHLPIGEPVTTAVGSRVSYMSFTPDRPVLFTLAEDGSIQQWDTLTRQIVGAPIATGQSQESGIAAGPAGLPLAATGKDGKVRLWDVAPPNDQIFTSLNGHQNTLYAIAYSPDDTTIATGDDDGVVILRNAEDGSQIGTPLRGHGDRISALAFSRDGALLASASADGTARIWDVTTGAPHGGPLVGHTGEVFAVAFSPAEERLATGGVDGTVRLWRAGDGTLLRDPLQAADAVSSLSFNPQGTVLAATGASGAISLWNTSSWQPMLAAPIQTGQGGVYVACFVRNGTGLASAGEDGTIRYWNADGKPVGQAIPAHEGAVIRLACSPDGSQLVSSGVDGRVLLWQVGGRAPETEILPAGDMGWQEVGFNGDGSSLAFTSSADDNHVSLNLWRIDPGELARAFPVFYVVTSSALNADGSRIAFGSNDGRVTVWDTSANRLVAEQRLLNDEAVSRVAFSQDGSRIAAGGINGSTHVWAIASTGSPARSLPGHADAVSALAFSPDGVWLASGANDGSVKIRDFTATSSAHDSSFTYTNAITGKPQPVAALAFSSDGALLSASSYRDITLWNVNDGEAAGPSLKGHAGWIYANAFRLVDHALTSGGDEGAVYMWDSDTGRLTDRLIGGGSDTILAIAVSSDARLLAAGTSGGEVELWDVTAASPVFLGNLPAAENGVRSLAFSADGRWLTATDQVGVVSRWDISESSWRQHACSLANRNLTLEEWRKYIGDPDDDDHDTRQICTEISGAGTAFLTPIVDPAL